MNGKEFFTNRYLQLGWKFQEATPKQAIRINTTNAKGKNLIERLYANGIDLKKIPFLENGYWISNAKVSAGATAEYLLGLYSIQEAAAQIPATQFTRLSDKKVLDACAAPGGKTVQLADQMNNTGTITALDVNKHRLKALANHLERCHVSNTAVYNLDARKVPQLNLKFDRILIDAPCSGNYATDKNWFQHRTLADVERNAKLQREILTQCAACLNLDGEIIYSTCSLEPEEDELNIDWTIKHLNLQTEAVGCPGEKGVTNVFGKRLDASVEHCRRIWPGETQGFFICKLKKRGDNA
ncbi:RsmB/NOP family class I SAM-dependent RNA methyltransferase [Candidatus Bathyarchaeota archaeon A05DMB-2]|jgi:NOL1/NOP2/sun family putative RNA methylase|nr:RsmB/NOP family class I SAM-dependent RNA methyltransferase [Candidatus Bathyarchaeota archaeon A05DMB-2]